MKLKELIKRALALCLAAAMPAGLAGCMRQVKAQDLMDGIAGELVASSAPSDETCGRVTAFAAELMKAASEREGNVLVSPLCVMSALAMTANGARGETLAEMEAALGLETGELNSYFAYAAERLEAGNELSLANSVWFRDTDDFTVNEDFLRTNAAYYRAAAYSAAFDTDTLKDINSWVSKNTHGMVPKILYNIDTDAVMYLISATAFEAEWLHPYKKYQVGEGEFNTAYGDRKTVDMMYSDELLYISDEHAEGFMKPYVGRRYAFAALLPNEGISLDEYVAGLDPEALCKMLREPASEAVDAAIPRFETGTTAELSDELKRMGIVTAFDADRADFSGLGTVRSGNVYLNRVMHRTIIKVDEKGTKAGAAAGIEMAGATAIETPHRVILDRPFLYLLVDTETGVPLFIGMMRDPA